MWRMNGVGQLDEVMSIPLRVGGVRVVESSEYSSFIWTAHTDPTLRLWTLNEPAQPIQNYTHHTMGVEDIAWSPFDGEEMVSAGKDSSWALWTMALSEPVFSVNHEARMPMLGVAFHPQNPAILFASPLDGQTEIWSLADRKRVYTLAPPEDAVFSSMAVSAYDENLFAVANESGYVQLWDLRNVRKPRRTFRAHGVPISDIKFRCNTVCV